MFKIISWLFFGFIIIIVLILFFVFGPWVYTDYKGCMDKEDSNISKLVDIYEVKQMGNSYTRYKYYAPFLCVDIYQNGDDCKDHGYGNIYHKIDATHMRFTGRILKTYSFNAFTSNSFDMEVLIDNKRYWIGKYAYDEIRYGGMYKNWPKDATEFQLKSCSIFSIRNFTVKH